MRCSPGWFILTVCGLIGGTLFWIAALVHLHLATRKDRQ